MRNLFRQPSQAILDINFLLALLSFFNISDFWFLDFRSTLVLVPIYYLFFQNKTYLSSFILQLFTCYHFAHFGFGGTPGYFVFLLSITVFFISCMEALLKNDNDRDLQKCLILVIALGYLMAALHKTNETFLFDQTYSCAYAFAKKMNLLETLQQFKYLGFVIVVYEYLIALLLLWPRYFKFGVIAASIFHLSIANLGLFLFTFLMLFGLNINLLKKEVFKFKVKKRIISFDLEKILTLSILFQGLIKLIIKLLYFPNTIERMSHVFPASTISILLPLFLGIFPLLNSTSMSYPKLNLRSLCFITVFLLNYLSPYIGLKTQYSFEMNSNLFVESESNNHLFIPNFNLLELNENLVEVLEIDKRYPEKLKEIMKKVSFMNRITLRRALDRNEFDLDKIYLKYKDHNGVFELTDAQSQFVPKRLNFFEKYFLGYQYINKPGNKVDCRLNVWF